MLLLNSIQKSMGIEKSQHSRSTHAQILSHGSVQSITCKVFNELVNNKLVPSPVRLSSHVIQTSVCYKRQRVFSC